MFLVDALITRAQSTLATLAGPPLARLSEVLILSLMSHISQGRLIVRGPDGRVHVFPDPKKRSEQRDGMEWDGLEAELEVKSDAFWIRLALGSDVGFAEAYMFGEVECSDLTSLFKLYIANRPSLSLLRTPLAALLALPQRLSSLALSTLPFYSSFSSTAGSDQADALASAKANIAAHYDISDRMFRAFLSEDMTYSCAIFPELDGDLLPASSEQKAVTSPCPPPPARLFSSSRPSSPSTGASTPTLASQSTPLPSPDPLAHAQSLKLHHILHLASLSPNQRVLEIGSGWGSLALLLASLHPTCEIDTLTLSTAQHAHLTSLILARGLSDRVRVHLMDYRALPITWTGRFHRVISLEMAEALGPSLLPSYFSTISRALHPTHGIAVLQVITLPESRLAAYSSSEDFIQRYIFPGGFLPSVPLLLAAAESGSSGTLVLEKAENIGPHYARTLREWAGRFEARFESDIAPALEEEYGMGPQEREVFRRKWAYYYAYCEAGFATRTLNDHILTFSREGNLQFDFDIFE